MNKTSKSKSKLNILFIICIFLIPTVLFFNLFSNLLYIGKSNKEEMSPSPPLLGTPRASLPARGSRLENPSMSPCSFGSCFLQSPRDLPSYLGIPYRKRGLLEKFGFETFLRVLHAHCSIQCFYTSSNFSSG